MSLMSEILKQYRAYVVNINLPQDIPDEVTACYTRMNHACRRIINEPYA